MLSSPFIYKVFCATNYFLCRLISDFKRFLSINHSPYRIFSIQNFFRANYIYFRNTISCPISVFFFRVFSCQNIIFSQIMTSNINIIGCIDVSILHRIFSFIVFPWNRFFSFEVNFNQIVLFYRVLPIALFFTSEFLLPRFVPNIFLDTFFP